MRKIELVAKGFVPLIFGVIFILIFSILEAITQSRLFFDLMSAGFILFWAYFGYHIGKDEGPSFKKVLLVHVIPALVVVFQILVMAVNSLTAQYTPSMVSQLFYLPTLNLIAGYFRISMEEIVIVSFIVMFIVFTLGMFKSTLQSALFRRRLKKC